MATPFPPISHEGIIILTEAHQDSSPPHHDDSSLLKVFIIDLSILSHVKCIIAPVQSTPHGSFNNSSMTPLKQSSIDDNHRCLSTSTKAVIKSTPAQSISHPAYHSPSSPMKLSSSPHHSNEDLIMPTDSSSRHLIATSQTQSCVSPMSVCTALSAHVPTTNQ